MKVLFVVKQRHAYHDGYSQTFPSGLLNSAQFVVDMLNEIGIEAKLVDVIDNNSIDKEVHDFNPDIVVIEALWVVPEKFTVLKKLHPKVKWVVRIHSEVPFLAQEGMAVEWLKAYVRIPNVFVSTNSVRGLDDLRAIVNRDCKVFLLPNFYPKTPVLPRPDMDNIVNVGCFGAIRPFKNQLLQAVAAIKYGDMTGKKIKFHVNSSRQETGGNSVLKNLRALFVGLRHQLVEHLWQDHAEFIKTLSKMDLSMSVSFSETFCIVAADAASIGVPIVVSDQVPWSVDASQASTTSSNDIVQKIKTALGWKSAILNYKNRVSLQRYSDKSRHTWLRELKIIFNR